jgi:chromosome segregation ATPase
MMKSATKDKVYKSPVRKLARFFEKSRDQWKAKCREAKKTIKHLENRVRFLEESRARWKSRAQELETRVKQMEVKERESKEKLETLEPRGSKKTVR